MQPLLSERNRLMDSNDSQDESSCFAGKFDAIRLAAGGSAVISDSVLLIIDDCCATARSLADGGASSPKGKRAK